MHKRKAIDDEKVVKVQKSDLDRNITQVNHALINNQIEEEEEGMAGPSLSLFVQQNQEEEQVDESKIDIEKEIEQN